MQFLSIEEILIFVLGFRCSQQQNLFCYGTEYGVCCILKNYSTSASKFRLWQVSIVTESFLILSTGSNQPNLTLRNQNVLLSSMLFFLRGNYNVLQISVGIAHRIQCRRTQGCAITQQSEMGWGPVEEEWEELCLWQMQVHKPQCLQVIRNTCIPK